MPTDDQQRWQEISRYLDEALELDEQARSAWLTELEVRAPQVVTTLRSLLADRDQLDSGPLTTSYERIGLLRSALTGQRLGAYTLDHVLGHGGMGTVWLAHRSDGRYEGRAAIKLLNASLLGRPTEQRFVQEGSLLAKLKHPNIAQLIDAGVAPSGQPYLILEYVEGERIDRYARQKKLDVQARILLFFDVLAAVAHAHSRLIVHRDIKPSNILVTNDGVVKLLDFGIAALLGTGDRELTCEVDPGLTPEYAAPEQLLKQPVTTATDVYALGLVLFLLLTQKHPLEPEGKSIPELARQTLDLDVPRASQVVDASSARALRGDLDNIVAKALKKDPNERYQTADALAQDLRNFLACQPVSARADSIAYRARKFVRRHRGAVALGAVLASVLLGATVLTTLQMIEARRQRDAALYESRRAEFQARFAYHIMAEVGDEGPITIRELMEKGMEVLEANYGDDPRFVIGMLINISGRYMNLGDTNGEYAALVKAEGLARQLADPEQISRVQCNTVETELAAGRPEQARERMRDGLENLARVPDPPMDRRTECGAAQARLLWAEGKLPEAIDAAEDIAKLLESSNATSDLLYPTLTTMLSVMLVQEGRYREARDWNSRLMEALKRSGNLTGLSLINARRHQADHLYAVGDVRGAFDIQKPLVEQLAAQEGMDNVPGAYAFRLGLYQVRLEATDEGMRWLDRAVQTATRMNEQATRIGALIARARAHVLLGKYENMLSDIDAAEHLAKMNEGENRTALRSMRLLRAELSFTKGDHASALEEAEQIVEAMGYPQKRFAHELEVALILKARAQLALGRLNDAQQTAQDAYLIATEHAFDVGRSANAGTALMVLADAHRAAGALEQARASARRAAETFALALGPNHSMTKAASMFD
jgi:eukaryotic-like serine/threonine-protein kinase